MLTIVQFIVIFFFSIVLLHNITPNENREKSESQQLHNGHRADNQTHISFSKDSDSYVFFLGLFMKQRTKRKQLTRHHQTTAEPALFRAAITLAQKWNITINGKRIAYRLEETNGPDIIEALDRTCVAIVDDKVLGIVGPEYSTEARILALFGNQVGLPIIGYSTTDPELSDRNVYRTFYRLPSSEVITARALLKLFQKYNWNSTNVIYQGDTFGHNGLQALIDVFNDEVKILRSIRFDLFTHRIENFRRQMEESPSRMVVVIATQNVTTNILQLALETGDVLAPSFLWILTTSNSSMDIPNNRNAYQLTGMLMLRRVSPQIFNISTNTTLLNEALDIWKNEDLDSFETNIAHLDVFALYAFDAAWLLILAFQELCQKNSSSCLLFENSSNCFANRLTARGELHTILQTISFTGLTGRVQFDSNTTDRIDGIGTHFVIENIQGVTNSLQVVEILRLNGTALNTTRNSTTEWITTGNPIRWPRNWNETPSDYALLKGKTLNITVYISSPFFMRKSSDTHGQHPYEGFIPDLVSLLQSKMKFNYIYIIASNETSYDELVECVQNRSSEIFMGDLAITAYRQMKIDFSTPIHDNTIRLVIRKSKHKTISPFGFFQPFSYELWLLIIFIFYLVSALLIGIYEYEEPTSNIRDKLLIRTFGRSLYYTIGVLLQNSSELQAKSLCGRIQTVIVALMSLILIALFTSNLIVYFTAQHEQPWLQSIDDLVMCRKVNCTRIGILEHSQHEEYFNNEVSNNREKNYYRLKHPHECFTKLVDGQIDVALVDNTTAEYFIQNEYCELEIAGSPFGRTDFGIAVPRQWPYKNDLDAHILKLRTNGNIDQLLRKYFKQKNCDANNNDKLENQNHALTLLETYGLLIIYGATTGVTFFLFVSYYIWKYKSNRTSSHDAVAPAPQTSDQSSNSQTTSGHSPLDDHSSQSSSSSTIDREQSSIGNT